MRFHAQKLMAKAQVASARLQTLPVGLVNSTIDLLSSLFPVASADRRPAPIDLTCPARPDAVAAAINDVGPEQIMERCGERTVSYTHLRAHETGRNLVCRLLLE